MTVSWLVEASPLGRVVLPPALPEGIALFYTTADFPGMLGDGGVERIHHFLHQRFGIEAQVASCTQVHGTAVQRVSMNGERWCEYGACDALFTASRNVALGIKVADCLPVTLVDPRHSVMANVHSGWRGAAANIVGVTLDRLASETTFDAAGASAWLGPSIRACCLEVGEEVIEAFEARHGDIPRFVDRTRGERPHIDLPALTRAVLTASGVQPANIADSGLCTVCDPLFHSYRRDRPLAGRNLAVVAQ